MNMQQANARRDAGGETRDDKPGVLSLFFSFLNTEHRTLNTVFALLTLLLFAAGTAYGGQKATGGDTITLTGGYWVHTFKNVGTAQFTPTNGDMAVEYLVVGGGGGGGHGNGGTYCSGGGGAGGLITSVIGCRSGGGTPGVGSTPSLPAALTASTAYDVTVGGGGAGASTEGPGTTGNDSVFGNVGSEFARAKGGGGGGRNGSVFSGGSGGGGGGYSALGGAGTVNQGWAGGIGYGDFGGGGGGALNVGGDSGGNGGNGGPGQTNSITGAWVAYAGGGGGGNGGNSGGTGGSGVGGNGGGNNPGTDGKGGGGGGGNNGQAGKGGSGVVIIRYKDVNTAPVAVGKNLTVYLSGNTVTVTGQQLDNGSTDADSDPLMFSINGQLSVTYTNGDFGDHAVTFAVYDGTAMSSCQQTVTVVQAGGALLASGGDVVSIYTNYAGSETQVVYGCHQYTGSAQFIPKKALAVEYLVIGGGGGGGSGNGNGTGGGGAGGYRCSVVGEKSGGNNNAEPVTNLTALVGVPVTVGSGGGANSSGNSSSFGQISSLGGGAGGSGGGGSGGSGGGGGYLNGGGSGTSLQGCNGGPAFDGGGQWGGGGGGGAKTAGIGRVDASTHGNGGDGLASSITGSSVSRAGGGASGNGNTGGTAGAGASAEGGGGNGGGGGGRNGIVIVRYVIPLPSVKVTAPTNNQVFAWNTSMAATATVTNATVTSVDFYTNTASAAYGLAGTDSDPTGGYTLSLAGGSLPAGTNHIYAVMNASEGVFTSAVNAIIVETLPTVTVTFPTNGQSFAYNSSLTATATVSHGIGPYTVTFYTNNDTTVGSTNFPPYTSSSFGPLTTGTYQVYARVVDSNPLGADTNWSTTNTFTIRPPALVISATGPTEYPYNGTIASTATVVFATGSYTVKVWTSSVPPVVWGQAGADGISTSPYGVLFGPVAPGQYSIRATVDDALPASATSSTYTVTVLTAPTVTLNTPTNNAQFALNASVTGTATCASGKTPYSVTFYTNKNGSAYGAAGTDVGTGARTSFTNVLSSLGAGTYGVYALVSDGYGSTATSGTNIVLVGGTLPTLSHRPPTAVTTGSATFNGFLSTTGNPSTYVYVLYGQNPNAWSYTNAVTAPGSGWTNNSPISTNISGLTPGLTYYYTIGASNGAPFSATTVASGTTNFITGEVTVQNTGTSAQNRDSGNINGQFTIYRPQTCTNAALVVSYTLSGATVSPSGSATLNAGSTSAVVTVAPSIIVGYSSNAVLTLTAGAGNYPYGTPANSATCTVLATDVTPPPPYKAWGGDVRSIITNNLGTSSQTVYAVHQYTNSASAGYFIPSENIGVQYLVVGGGGGGGHGNSGTYCSGGGGAGGLITSVIGCRSGGGTPGVGSTPSLPAALTASTAYDVTVGGGGAGASTEGPGTTGNDSVFGNAGNEFARAKGGGGGGRNSSVFSGGSGGGGGGYSALGGAGTVNQGCAGGIGYGDFGGGGGGALNVGGDSGGNGGNGGPGQTNNITGAWVAYAGGGGGGNGGNSGGTGGSGVGGNGGGNNPGTDGRGGGGGGGNNGQAGKGGSGIVIIRYKLANTAPVVVGKNITVYISSNKVAVAAQQIDNGSSDADGDSLLYKINGQDSVTFTQADLGNQTVTLTVYDGFGGSNSVQQTVTVLGGGGLFRASGGDSAYVYTNFPGTSSQTVYDVHIFSSTGTASFIPTVALKGVEYLVVGGGGGGAGNSSTWANGGGGAGGLITSVSGCYSGGGTAGLGSAPTNTAKLTAGTAYTVTVGGGGAGGGGNGGDGADSVFGNSGAEFARALGGGGGGRGGNGRPGGSGGGCANGYTPGAGTANQGWRGGLAGGNDHGSGGGGAGNAGSPGNGPANGGPGLTNNITGNNVVYAGGGGGGAGSNPAGSGGSGGGGNGGGPNPGQDGLGGGGGGGQSTLGGKGGSGIVIVRYAMSPDIDVLTNSAILVDGGTNDFDRVRLGTTNMVTMTITNSGTAALTLNTNILIDGTAAAQFFIASVGTNVLQAGQTATVVVACAPTNAVGLTAMMHITNDARYFSPAKNPYDITLKATGVTPDIEVLRPNGTLIGVAGTNDFGNVRLGTTNMVSLMVTNSGTDVLTLNTNILIDSTAAAQFFVYNLGTNVLQPNQTTTLVVACAPTNVLRLDAALHLTNNAIHASGAKNPYNITLTATGITPNIDVLTNGLELANGGTNDFGVLPVGTTTVVTLTITNAGSATLNLAGIALSDSEFTIGAPGTNSLEAHLSTTLAVTCTPTVASLGIVGHSTSLHITNDASFYGRNPYDITLKVKSITPNIEVRTNGVLLVGGTNDFGEMPWYSTNAVTLTITNTGSARLTLGGIATQDLPSVFTLGAPGTNVLEVGEFTTLAVTCTPTAASNYIGHIYITNNAIYVDAGAKNPYGITLKVTGLEPEIGVALAGVGLTNNVSTNDFGVVNVGYSSATKTYVVTNSGGATLMLGSVLKGGEGSNDFTVSTGVLSDLLPGSNTQFTVTFEPVTSGVRTASLTIENNDRDEQPFRIGLTGIASNSPLGPFGATNVTEVGADLHLELHGKAGRTYRILSSNDAAQIHTLVGTIAPQTNSFTFVDSNVVGNAAITGLYYQVAESNSTTGAWTTNPLVWALENRNNIGSNKWHLLTVPVDYGDTNQNTLAGELGRQLAGGLIPGNGSSAAPTIWLWDYAANKWTNFWLFTDHKWYAEGGSQPADLAIEPGRGFWLKSYLNDSSSSNTVFTGLTHTNSTSVQMITNRWMLFAWPYATPGLESQGWKFLEQGGHGGTSADNADNIFMQYNGASYLLWMKTNGSWYVQNTTNRAPAGINLNNRSAYFYYARNTNFLWKATKP